MTISHPNELERCYFAKSGILYENPGLIDIMLSNADIRLYKKGDFLYADSDIDETLFILLKGTIETYYVENNKKRTIGLWNEATSMGAAMLISRKKHATVCCKSDCTLALISRKQLDELEHNADILMLLLRMQAEKMRMILSQIKSLSFDSTQRRLLIFLYEAAMQDLCLNRTDIPVRIRFSKQEIADLINTSREYVSLMLKELQKSLHLKVHGSEIIVIPAEIEACLRKI